MFVKVYDVVYVAYCKLMFKDDDENDNENENENEEIPLLGD
jgi:hypothetical protein